MKYNSNPNNILMGGYLVTAGQMDDVIEADVDVRKYLLYGFVVTMEEVVKIQTMYEKKYDNLELMDEDLFTDVLLFTHIHI